MPLSPCHWLDRCVVSPARSESWAQISLRTINLDSISPRILDLVLPEPLCSAQRRKGLWAPYRNAAIA